MIRESPKISEGTFDVIVIGAGINGAGIARDAAMRGLKVLLLDKGDIGGGTSSWSTRLIHGGLRYLEHGEFRLVRESLRERSCLLNICPHLVRPIPLLVLENVLSAVAHGATVFTYARVEKLIVENAAVRGVEFTRESRCGGTTVTEGSGVARQTAYADIVINAAGPWVDQVLTESNADSPRLIGGTKGSHIIVAPFPGAAATAIYIEAETDGRPFFIIPWNGKYLIGTTDIRYEGDLDDV